MSKKTWENRKEWEARGDGDDGKSITQGEEEATKEGDH